MEKIDKLNEVCISEWNITTQVGSLPILYNEFVANATFVDLIDMNDTDKEGVCFYAISTPKDSRWPEIVIAERYSPSAYGFIPSILIVPETSIVFLGAGTCLLAYDVSVPKKIWEDYTECGFWGWRQYDDVVLMSAELELAAWNTKGEKLWTTYVEPPWSFTVTSDYVNLDVMGEMSRFDIHLGP